MIEYMLGKDNVVVEGLSRMFEEEREEEERSICAISNPIYKKLLNLSAEI